MRATFFVLGAAAAQCPEWVRRIAGAGHEIGTHGWSHMPLYRQSRADFAGELRRAVGQLQDLTGRPVHGHRAALFSVTAQTPWAFDVLCEAGLCYDSSVFPVHNYRYGIPSAPRFPHRMSGGLWELPVTTVRAARLNVPVGGGFYARFWPGALLRWAVARLNRQGRPAVFYFHPWEFDPAQPRLRAGARRLALATHYYRLGGTRATLRRLLDAFEWGAAADYLQAMQSESSGDDR